MLSCSSFCLDLSAFFLVDLRCFKSWIDDAIVYCVIFLELLSNEESITYWDPRHAWSFCFVWLTSTVKPIFYSLGSILLHCILNCLFWFDIISFVFIFVWFFCASSSGPWEDQSLIGFQWTRSLEATLTCCILSYLLLCPRMCLSKGHRGSYIHILIITILLLYSVYLIESIYHCPSPIKASI